MARITKDQVLEFTDGGRLLFQFLCPSLQFADGKFKENIDSPISKGKKTFSVFSWGQGKYYFKDHYSQQKGDIFQFVAIRNGLNSQREFPKVLDIIEGLLREHFSAMALGNVKSFFNPEDKSRLVLMNEEYSKPILGKYFMSHASYLDHNPKYKILVVERFSLTDKKGKFRKYKFDFSRPEDAVYALTIIENEFYILFNPHTRDAFKWGKEPEFYIAGLENLFKIAYQENIYLRKTIVVTNRVEGLLFLQDKGIPSVAILDGEMALPEFFEKEILPMFNSKYIFFELIQNGDQQTDSFVYEHGFNKIQHNNIYLFQFFREDGQAVDTVMKQIAFLDDFEYEGFQSPVIESPMTDFEKFEFRNVNCL